MHMQEEAESVEKVRCWSWESCKPQYCDVNGFHMALVTWRTLYDRHMEPCLLMPNALISTETGGDQPVYCYVLPLPDWQILQIEAWWTIHQRQLSILARTVVDGSLTSIRPQNSVVEHALRESAQFWEILMSDSTKQHKTPSMGSPSSTQRWIK